LKKTSIAVRPINGNEYYGQMFPLKSGGAFISFLGVQQASRTTAIVRWEQYVGSHVEWSTTHGGLTINYGNSTLDLGNRYVFSLNCDLNVTVTAVVTPTCGNCSSYTDRGSFGICEL
jgi:hypothetical protein